MRQADILIIGNGILGLSTALSLSLKAPDTQITVLGPATPDHQASLASGAMLGCFSEITKLIHDTKPGVAKFDLARTSQKLWPAWLKILQEQASITNPATIHYGTYLTLTSASGKLDTINYEAILRTLKKHKEPHSEVNPLDIPGLYPVENLRPIKAVYIPNEGFIDSNALIRTLHTALKKQKNIKFVNAVATRIITKNNHISEVETSSGKKIETNSALLAAGAQCQSLLDTLPDLAFRIPPIYSGCGTAILITESKMRLKNVIRTPNRAGQCGLHILPRNNNLIYLGASNYVSSKTASKPKIRSIEQLLKLGTELFNQDLHDARVEKILVGNRPVSLDCFPLFGKTSVNGLWISTGTYRDGLQLSPLLAKTMSTMILENKPSPFTLFAPERKPISLYSKQEAIDAYVTYCSSVSYDHGISLPKMGWDLMLREMYHKHITSLYEELDTEVGLLPSILNMLDRERDRIPLLRNYLQKTEVLYKARKTTDIN